MLDFLGGIIAYPFRWINSIFPNYVVTLLLFAVLMKLILFPLGIKQQKNSQKQAALRPYETLIRKKYAGRDDKVSKQKMQEEIMDLYKKENFNPASGCLPMLLQLPILFALYQVIIKPAKFLLLFPNDLLEKIGTVYDGLIKELGMKAATQIVQINKILSVDLGELSPELADQVKTLLGSEVTVKGAATTVGESLTQLKGSFNLFGLNLMDTPTLGWNALIIVPILVFVFSFASMKLTKKFTYQPSMGQDNATKSSMALMDITMPLMSTWISFMMPAGIGIYWIIQNVLGVLQQFALYKMFPIPQMTDEDVKEAEQKMRGKSKRVELSANDVKEVASAPRKNAPSGGKKKGQPVTRRPQITDHGKTRVKEHGTVPHAKRRP